MNPLKALAFLLLTTNTATADGPALAFVTLGSQTLTLTAQNAPNAPAMIRQDGPSLHLRFADLRLSFPLPPTLDVTLTEGADGWQAGPLHLHRLPPDNSLSIRPEAMRIIEASGNDINSLRIVLEAEALAPGTPTGATLLPVHIEITLSSP